MSDIRKEFEVWVNGFPEEGRNAYYNEGRLLGSSNEHAYIFFKEGFQAGRAHNVDGLIAEINSLDSFHGCIRKEDVNLLIRKHLGNE